MKDGRVTKTHLSAVGVTFFTLIGNDIKSNCLRDPANGMPTGKRMHKPLAITKEIDKTLTLLINELVKNENIEKWKIGGFYKK